MAFGFGILAAVYTVATVSGAHINPAVTFGLAAAREFPWRLVPAYWAAQLLGGIVAALVNWAMYGDKLRSALDLGTTRPGPGVSLIAAACVGAAPSGRLRAAAQQALTAAIRAFGNAARAHEQAAIQHERTAAAGYGDQDEHTRNAANYRAAAIADTRRAECTSRCLPSW